MITKRPMVITATATMAKIIAANQITGLVPRSGPNAGLGIGEVEEFVLFVLEKRSEK